MSGAVVLSSVVSPLSADGTTLMCVSEAGIKLTRITGSGAAQVKLSLAGDLNNDGMVNGLDSQLWEQSQTSALSPIMNK